MAMAGDVIVNGAWFALSIVNVCDTLCAAKKSLLPACVAVIVHEPARTRLMPPPDTVQNAAFDEFSVTVRPDDAVGATGMAGSPYVAPVDAGFAKLIV